MNLFDLSFGLSEQNSMITIDYRIPFSNIKRFNHIYKFWYASPFFVNFFASSLNATYIRKKSMNQDSFVDQTPRKFYKELCLDYETLEKGKIIAFAPLSIIDHRN